MKSIRLLLLSAFLLISGCDSSSDLGFDDTYVVEAFIFENEPVSNIRVTLAGSTTTDDPTETAVNNALVVLSRGSDSWTLESTNTDGFYHYGGSDLVVNQGDTFSLEIIVGGQTLTADTTVPLSPEGVSVSTDTITLPDFNADPFRLREVLRGTNANIIVTWDNSNQDYFFIAVRVPELSDPDYILPDFIRDRFAGFERITEPTVENFYEVPFRDFEVFGIHYVSVYRVNDEYAALYESREQDSRDLNEPPSNIRGGVGVFSGFSTVLTSFTIIKE